MWSWCAMEEYRCERLQKIFENWTTERISTMEEHWSETLNLLERSPVWVKVHLRRYCIVVIFSCTDDRMSDSLTDWNWRLAISHVWLFSHYPSCILSSGQSSRPGKSGQHGQFGQVNPISVITLVSLVTRLWSPWSVWLLRLIWSFRLG